MIVLGQTQSDESEELLSGPGSVDLGAYGIIYISIGVPPVETIRISFNDHTQKWHRMNAGQLQGPGNEWRSLIIME